MAAKPSLDARASGAVVHFARALCKLKPPASPRRFYALSDSKFRQTLFQPFLRFARAFFNLFTSECQEAAPALDARAARKLGHAPAAPAREQTLYARDVRETYAPKPAAPARDPKAQRATPQRRGRFIQHFYAKRPSLRTPGRVRRTRRNTQRT
jgi:hypothetical protein